MKKVIFSLIFCSVPLFGTTEIKVDEAETRTFIPVCDEIFKNVKQEIINIDKNEIKNKNEINNEIIYETDTKEIIKFLEQSKPYVHQSL